MLLMHARHDQGSLAYCSNFLSPRLSVLGKLVPLQVPIWQLMQPALTCTSDSSQL